MKKTFLLESDNRKPARVLDAIKHEVRKYLKRERRRELPEDMDYWDFDCRVGVDEANAGDVHVGDMMKAIEKAASESTTSIYIEVLAKSAKRVRTIPIVLLDQSGGGDSSSAEETAKGDEVTPQENGTDDALPNESDES